MATDEGTATTSMDAEEASDSEGGRLSRQPSDSSLCQTEDEEDSRVPLGPKMSIRQHLEIDKVSSFDYPLYKLSI